MSTEPKTDPDEGSESNKIGGLDSPTLNDFLNSETGKFPFNAQQINDSSVQKPNRSPTKKTATFDSMIKKTYLNVATPDSDRSARNSNKSNIQSDDLKQSKQENDLNPNRKNTDILDSLAAKDTKLTLSFLKKYGNRDATCQNLKISLVHLAAYLGENEVLSEVIRAEPDLIKSSDSAGRNPLHYASWKGNWESIAALLELQPAMFKPDEDNENEEKETDKVKEIKINYEKVRMLNAKKGTGSKTFLNLCDSSHSCNGLSIKLNKIWSQCTPLHIACARLHKQSALALLACGADISKCDASGRTPLDVVGLQCYESKKLTEDKSNNFVRIIESVSKFGKHQKISKSKWLSNQNGMSSIFIAIVLDTKRGTNLLLDIGADQKVINDDGLTPLHLAVQLKRQNVIKTLSNATNAKHAIDKTNRDGLSPLQLAISDKWIEGISILLEAGASVLSQVVNTKDTAIHLAAELGNLDIMESVIKKLGEEKEKSIDMKNSLGETPLFVSVKYNNVECMKFLIREGASTSELSDGSTVLHKAIELSDPEMLKSLLEMEEGINLLNITDISSRAPLHYAAFKGKADYTQIIIDKGAALDIKTVEGYTPLHIAAENGNADVIKVLLKNDKNNNLITISDNKGWIPFYTATMNCQRESINIFLKNGSNLSEVVKVTDETKVRVIDIITENMPRSADYLRKIFDESIMKSEHSLDHPDCVVTFDYSIIMPNKDYKVNTQTDAKYTKEGDDANVLCEKIPLKTDESPNRNVNAKPHKNAFSQMKTVSALFSAGSNFEIKKLILHPFIESFLFLKWNILKWLFFAIFGIYLIFVVLLTDSALYAYDENYQNWSSNYAFFAKNIALIVIIGIILALELIFMQIKGRKYFSRVEGWVKPGSVIMASIFVIDGTFYHTLGNLSFVSSVALLLSWVEITILLSRFPECGYYYQMFSTVAVRVVKVLVLFGSFFIVGFSLIFWILINDNESFSRPWDSLMKTIVMMTSEFDYGSLIENQSGIQLFIIQLFFIIFLVCVPIVLMNLLLALAVSDVKDLETEGKIQRLSDQVEFLGNLEFLIRKMYVADYLITNKWKVDTTFKIFPGKPLRDPDNRLPKRIMEPICDYFQTTKINEEIECEKQQLLERMDRHQLAIDKLDEINRTQHETLLKMINQLNERIGENKSQKKSKSRWTKIFNF